jgi:nitroimidazol reductase NimA-like FMN-containing flavoprotein (pyridoxamine 5'-phosphate oxidase superfamily)
MTWADVEPRLAAARVYWIATAGPDGRAHVRPVDGLYHEGTLYVGGSPETRWVRDIAGNPHVSVHLDGGHDVLILEGEARILDGLDRPTAERLAAISSEKYPAYGMTADNYSGPGTIAFRPSVGFAWKSFPKDVTRFRFA